MIQFSQFMNDIDDIKLYAAKNSIPIMRDGGIEFICNYIKEHNINYCKDVYGEIIEGEQGKLKFSQHQRTGCTFCMFGVHLEQQPNRFQRMEIENPRLYKYCMEELNLKKVLDFINVPYRYSDYHEQQQINFIRED